MRRPPDSLTREWAWGHKRHVILDFHNHIYPETIAQAVTDSLREEKGFRAFGTGTVAGLRDEMKTSGVDACGVLGVAVSPALVESTNRWILKQAGKGLFPVGSIHPWFEQYKLMLDGLEAAGVKGIKFHPMFQKFHPDDERVFPLYEEIIRRRMFVVFHSGPGLTMTPGEEVMGTPERIRRVLEIFPNMTLVAAHFGGFRMIEESKRHLLGNNLFFDTAYPPGLCFEPTGWVLEMIEGHDPDRILFGTDTPFARQKEDMEYILRLPISDDLKEKILWKNGAKLLGLA